MSGARCSTSAAETASEETGEEKTSDEGVSGEQQQQTETASKKEPRRRRRAAKRKAEVEAIQEVEAEVEASQEVEAGTEPKKPKAVRRRKKNKSSEHAEPLTAASVVAVPPEDSPGAKSTADNKAPPDEQPSLKELCDENQKAMAEELMVVRRNSMGQFFLTSPGIFQPSGMIGMSEELS